MLSELKRISKEIDEIILQTYSVKNSILDYKFTEGLFYDEYLGDVLDSLKSEMNEVIQNLEVAVNIIGEGDRFWNPISTHLAITGV